MLCSQFPVNFTLSIRRTTGALNLYSPKVSANNLLQVYSHQRSMKMSRAPTILLAVGLLVTCLTACEAETHVRITNKLTSGKMVTVHCKSKDDDLGFHDLSSESSYEFSFKHDFFGRTLFFCSVKWEGHFHYFDAYKSSYDCQDCNWEIRDTAACRIKNTPAGICIDWK